MSRDEYLDPSSLFRRWKNGNHNEVGVVDPPSPEEAKPFHVLGHGNGYIPISMLVFARDADHALERVLVSLRWMTELPYGSTSKCRATQYLKEIANGELTMYVAPYDVRLIAANVNWAGNGGI